MKIGRTIKFAAAGIAAAGLVAVSASAASAASLGGDAFAGNCHAYILPYSDMYAYGHVDGPANECKVDLWQTNTQTGGWTHTGWGSGVNTWPEYHNDGVHKLQVEVMDINTNQISWGSLVF
ncbi:hypothetical protein [Streptomyces sp. CBMA152]|uniref:hypothetical protein n=1 Tax=Streptomyces sp. CBMA152 TaxID=1896312 RepID=UPI00166164F2|nr:hypothetical protein [Streptomyces sp. CBMA152]